MASRFSLSAALAALVLALSLSACDSDAPPTLIPGDDGGSDTDGPPTDNDGGPIEGCGNGVKENAEQCDNGKANGPGTGCELDCTFSCVGPSKCDDGDPCTGMETCGMDHTCKPGTPLPAGTSCGTNKICKNGACGDITCGDGITTAPEECDDGNVTDGDGCEKTCRFTCLSTDNTRNCAATDPCMGTSMCDNTKHTCTPRTPLADNTSCGTNKYCKMGACITAVCGNNQLEPGEVCDDGNQTAGDGCEPGTCRYSCVDPVADCKMTAPPCQKWSCNNSRICAAVADTAKDNQSCGMNLVCKAGACVAQTAVCGNGVVETGEDCDFGGGNGAGTGCETNCKFSCVKSPDSCPDNNICNGAESCATVMVSGKTGQRCMAGTAAADGTACGMTSICLMGACKLSACGDGYVDMARGEQCEPPSTNVCDSMCKKPAVCGNAVREAGEQCDDGNTTNLDGCSGTCLFEQSQRINWFNMRFVTDTTCTANALGRAVVGGIAQGQLQTSITDGVNDGSITILFAMLGLKDLSGTNENPITIGVLNGTPQRPMGAPMYNGASDLDWWYTGDPMALDMMRVPTAKLTGSIAAKQLVAGPGNLTLNLVLGGSLAPFRMSNVRVRVLIGNVSMPLLAQNNLPPGHLASERLDPALTSYATAGQPNVNGGGSLCANVSASSLSKVLLPTSITQNCTQYNGQNSMLDLIVGGCTVFGFLVQIAPTQPDTSDPTVQPVGAGAPYRLSAGTNRIVNACRDRNNVVVNLANCLDAAAYSSYFKFATDRVIIK